MTKKDSGKLPSYKRGSAMLFDDDALSTTSFNFNGYGNIHLPFPAPVPAPTRIRDAADGALLSIGLHRSSLGRATWAYEEVTIGGVPYCRTGLTPRSLVPGTPASGASARKLLERARGWIESHADDETLSVDMLASALNMSRTSLHRKLVSGAGQPPGQFIRTVRLQLAHRLLQRGEGNVSQIAYAVGFVSLSGFSRAYRALYGKPPSRSRPRVCTPNHRPRHGWNESTSN
jgi:AraC-like DNA-binding protein